MSAVERVPIAVREKMAVILGKLRHQSAGPIKLLRSYSYLWQEDYLILLSIEGELTESSKEVEAGIEEVLDTEFVTAVVVDRGLTSENFPIRILIVYRSSQE